MHERRGESGLPASLRGEAFELASAIAGATRDGIAIVDAGGGLVFWNAAAATITGWSIAEARRQLARILSITEALHEIREGKWIELRRTEFSADGKSYQVIFFTDSTPHIRLRNTHDQLRALGLIDGPTNLAGRELAIVHIEHAIALARRDQRSVGILSLKLDRFHELRGPANKPAADQVIRQFAQRVAAFIRGSDVPARMSEDSFLVVLTALTSSNDAVVVAVRLLLALAEPFDVVGKARSVHCSVGVAEFPRDADEPLALLGAALGAADRAQVMGGGRYCLASEVSGR